MARPSSRIQQLLAQSGYISETKAQTATGHPLGDGWLSGPKVLAPARQASTHPRIPGTPYEHRINAAIAILSACLRPAHAQRLLHRLGLGGIAQREVIAVRRHFQMALMELRQGRAMADGDDCGVRQALRQHGVEFRLQLFLDGGRGFVEQQPVGTRQQGARNRQTLLLAARQAQ